MIAFHFSLLGDACHPAFPSLVPKVPEEREALPGMRNLKDEVTEIFVTTLSI